jgi:Immunity protein 50
MSHSNLSNVLRNASEIESSANFAALGECELYYFHFDERNPHVIAAFYRHNASRDLVRHLGGAADHNTVSLFVAFRDVRKFTVNGWGVDPASVFVLDLVDDGLDVKIRGPETSISFVCSKIILDHVTTYDAGTP